MTARKSEKPAGRGVRDREVLTERHDALLTWLIEHLPSIVASSWGMPPEQVVHHLEAERVAKAASAKASATWFGSILDGTTTLRVGFATYIIGGKSTEAPVLVLDAEDRCALDAAVARTPAVIEAIRNVEAPEGAGCARLVDYEVMVRVCKIEKRQRGDDMRTDAGYVDLVARAEIPSSVRIEVEGLGSHSSMDGVLFEEASLREQADAFARADVSVANEDSSCDIWFSVRAESFTLGEVLQELKTLQALETGQHLVALVVHEIAPSMQAVIEREGFVVIRHAAGESEG